MVVRQQLRLSLDLYGGGTSSIVRLYESSFRCCGCKRWISLNIQLESTPQSTRHEFSRKDRVHAIKIVRPSSKDCYTSEPEDGIGRILAWTVVHDTEKIQKPVSS